MSNDAKLAIEKLRLAMNTLDKPKVDHWEVNIKDKNGKPLKFFLEQKCYKVQIPGRPWAFNASQHLGWWARKYGIYYLEDGMVHLCIDDMDPIVFPQPNPIDNHLFSS